MILSCSISVLKSHSDGHVFEAVAVANHYELQNNLGEVLIGIRGAVYQFKTQETAENWLDSNLKRVRKAGEIKESYLIKLHLVYSETNADYLMRELEAIAEFNAGAWQINEGNQMPVLAVIDGGNAFSVYDLVLNP